MVGTIWALIPPVIAIGLALITKEVYLSLMNTIFEIMTGKIGSNCDILIFLVMLGILVALITKSGASRAYGKWALKAIKSKRQAMFATSLLGTVIFVDDYFNCLTVGTVMKPITDKYKITRAKLAYVIDATAAPICIIAPISSWAAAVGSSRRRKRTGKGPDPSDSVSDCFLYWIYALYRRIF